MNRKKESNISRIVKKKERGDVYLEVRVCIELVLHREVNTRVGEGYLSHQQ